MLRKSEVQKNIFLKAKVLSESVSEMTVEYICQPGSWKRQAEAFHCCRKWRTVHCSCKTLVVPHHKIGSRKGVRIQQLAVCRTHLFLVPICSSLAPTLSPPPLYFCQLFLLAALECAGNFLQCSSRVQVHALPECLLWLALIALQQVAPSTSRTCILLLPSPSRTGL